MTKEFASPPPAAVRRVAGRLAATPRPAGAPRRVVDAIRDRRFPHKEKLNSVLGSSKTDLVVSDAFVVEVYFAVLAGMVVEGLVYAGVATGGGVLLECCILNNCPAGSC